MESKQDPIVIVGGGLSGMRCAQLLAAAGLPVTLIEAEDRLGGRVQTDEIEGFLLDRGFQVLLTEYPEAQEVFDYDALDLRYFESGALVRIGDGFVRVSDPIRSPSAALATLRAPIGDLRDKLKILKMRSALAGLSERELFARPEVTAMHALVDRWGFSNQMVQRFFRPFFGGILLDESLRGSSRMMEYVFKLFTMGHAAVPEGGMGQLSSQLAARLREVDVRLGTPVRSVDHDHVVLSDDTRLEAQAVVVAADGPEANRLLGTDSAPKYVGTRCYYFAVEQPPHAEPLLILNGDGRGPINNLVVLSNVAPAYARSGESLVSVTVLDDGADVPDELPDVRVQLSEWYGPQVQRWRHIRTYHIPTALPDQAPPFLSPVEKSVRVGPSIYRCGDYVDTASINGALRSGRRAAEAVIEDLAD